MRYGSGLSDKQIRWRMRATQWEYVIDAIALLIMGLWCAFWILLIVVWLF